MKTIAIKSCWQRPNLNTRRKIWWWYMYLGFKPNSLKDMKHGLQHNDIQSIGPLEKSIFLERGRLRASEIKIYKILEIY